MKIVVVPILLTLALCLIQDAASEDENQETCREFRALMKTGKLFCPQDKNLFQSPDGRKLIQKCAMCKVILEKEAKSQRKASYVARATRATDPPTLNCNDFKKRERDGNLICTFDNAAVCGTDGKTYSNRCTLCAENEKTRSQVGIKSEGECEKKNPEQDVCRDFRPYVRNGRLGCTREHDPVLGPDGRTHGNKCAMCAELFLKEAKENAKQESESRVPRNAEKDFCKEFESQVREGRLFCTRENDPVRGPDGRMHGNKCALCAEIFKQRFLEEKNKADENLRKVAEKVQAKRDLEELCSEYRKVFRNGKLLCTRENDPIQGPDGKIHGNTCSMCEAFLQLEEKKKKEDEARNKRQTDNTKSFEELCREYHKLMQNGRLLCTRENDPIRGPDGKMHGNTCSMCEALFQQQETARAKAKRDAAKDLCSEFRDQVRNGMLICTRENDPILGPDGKLHGNKCAMCASVFKAEEDEKKRNDKGEKEKPEAEKVKREAVQELCREYRNYMRNGRLACTRENDPIEGPDGKIHGNTCSMCEAFFQQEEKEKEAKSRAKVKRSAQIDTCSEFRSLMQNGTLFCTRENDPVRGPDGKTHGNKCAMCKAVFQKEDEERKRKEEDDRGTASEYSPNGGRDGIAQDQCAEYREKMKHGKLSCSRESDPVRDADGNSYNNKCLMCKEILRREANEKSKTESESKKDVCDEYRSQMKNGKLICTRESDPVRGPDGKAHGNKCAMCKERLEREAAEKKKKEEEDMRKNGEKSNENEDQCHEFRKLIRNGKLICTRENDPVRGPYGKMHVNKCAMCQSIFEREASERKKNDEENSSAQTSNASKDECDNFRHYIRNGQLICTRENDPVRGPDGTFYKNKCFMCIAVFRKEALEKSRILENSIHNRASEEEDSQESSNSSLNSDMCKHYRVLPRIGYLCPKNLQPVCGDDGQTYNNPCMLCHENLIRQTDTRILSAGSCEENNTSETIP